jgi:cell division protein FtsQ
MSNKRELSRAELVRARRAQRSAKEMQEAAKQATKPLPHVSTRVVTPYVQPKLKPVKPAAKAPRRFDIAFGMPNFTLHKPTFRLPRPAVNWRTASFVMVFVFAILIYCAWTLPYFHIPQATVLGNNRLTREEINAVLGVQGQSIFLVKPEEVETRVRLNYPELASAEVKVYLPNYVYVTVTERQPVILLQQGEGFTWVDATGVAFRPRGDGGVLIPLIANSKPPAGVAALDDPFSPPPYMQKELVDAVLALAPSVPAGSTLTFDEANGLGWTDSRGWKAYFGTSAQDMPLKIQVYRSLVDSLVGRNKIPEYINVAYADAPYYRMPELTETSEENLAESGQ